MRREAIGSVNYCVKIVLSKGTSDPDAKSAKEYMTLPHIESLAALEEYITSEFTSQAMSLLGGSPIV